MPEHDWKISQSLEQMVKKVPEITNELGRIATALESIAESIRDAEEIETDDGGDEDSYKCTCDLQGRPCTCDCWICVKVREREAAR